MSDRKGGMRHLASAWLLMPVMMGCSSTSNADGAASDLPSCAGAPNGILKVEGDVAGDMVLFQESPAPGGFSQLQQGQFDTPPNISINGMVVPPDPGQASIHLTWNGLISDGSSGATVGTVVLPIGNPHAGETVCAGTGSQVVMPESGDFIQFDLRSLANGDNCAQPQTGRLRVCWSSANH